MSQTISAICSISMTNNLKKYGQDVAMSVIVVLAEKYGFDKDEAFSAITLDVSECRGRRGDSSRPTSRSSPASRTSVEPSSLPVPFCGMIVDGWCYGVRPNGGLYTQCSKEPDEESAYCDTCRKQSVKNINNMPNGGDICERKTLGAEWRDPKGKAPVNLANYLKRKNIEVTEDFRNSVLDEAKRLGFTISDDEWIVKESSRGRPRKTKTAVVDTTATEDECESDASRNSATINRKKIASPKSKLESGSESSDCEELVLATPSKSSLVKRRSTISLSPKPGNSISPIQDDDANNSISPVVLNDSPKETKQNKPKMSAEEKESAKVAKAAAKLAEKEAAKALKAAEKLAEKEAAKAAKAAAKLAEKEAAKAAKAAEKLAEKEAAKAAKLAEKEAAKLSDNDASKALENAEKLVIQDAEQVSPVIVNREVYEDETKRDELLFGATTQEDESDDESDDEAAGVEEFELNEVKYLRDPKTNDIFDFKIFMDSGDAEEIGVYKPETNEIVFNEE